MIAVLGASGRVGRHVAAGLADAGVPARALVRNPDRVVLPIDAVHADLRRPDTLPAALRGVERLLVLTPHVPEQDLLEAAAVDAAASAGVRRIVKVSGGPATLGPNGTTATATAHWRGEQRIERAGLEFASCARRSSCRTCSRRRRPPCRGPASSARRSATPRSP